MEESHKTHRPHIKVGKDEENKKINNRPYLQYLRYLQYLHYLITVSTVKEFPIILIITFFAIIAVFTKNPHLATSYELCKNHRSLPSTCVTYRYGGYGLSLDFLRLWRRSEELRLRFHRRLSSASGDLGLAGGAEL